MTRLLAALLVLIPVLAFGQSGGPFVRPGCTSLTNPVTHASVCFDTTAHVGAWKVWDGARWVTSLPGQTGSVNVRDYGATGNGTTDDTAAIQAAITAAAGRQVFVPPGTYVVTSTVAYSTSGNTAGLKIAGAGMYHTVFDNRVASGPMIRIDGDGTAAQSQRGAVLEGFTITTTTSPANSDGIEFVASWNMRVEGVRIHGLTGNGIVGISTGDPDSSAYFVITRSLFTSNTKWGIDLQDSGLTIVFGEVSRNQFQSNTAGGIRMSGQLMRVIQNSFVLSGIGLHIKDGGGSSPRNVAIFDNEFQSSVTAHIKIDYGVGIEGGRNHLNADDQFGSFQPPVAVDIGSGAGLPNAVKFSRDVVRILNRGANPHTVYRIGVNASNVVIETPIFTSLDGATKYTDAGFKTSLIDVNASTVMHATGGIGFHGLSFSDLGAPQNGTFLYCSDCTFANPCAGSGTGAFAKRLAGAWRCD